MGSERRGRAVHGRLEVNPSGEEPTDRPRQKNAGLWEPYDGRLSRTVLRERVKGRFPPATHQSVTQQTSRRPSAVGGDSLVAPRPASGAIDRSVGRRS